MSFAQPSDGLVACAQSSRQVAASMERIYENVRDWEHLPHLHQSSFVAIELIEENHFGFKAYLTSTARPDRRDLVEVFIEADRNRYWNVTSHAGQALAEVHVQLTPLDARITRIDLTFHLRAAQAQFGPAFAKNYDHLWDEDEAMMITRQHFLDSRGQHERMVILGPITEVQARLPFTQALGGRDYHLFEGADGTVQIFDATCPHFGGPVERVSDREVRCPWHGYRFDLVTGASLDGHSCKLKSPARLEMDAQGIVQLIRPDYAA